MNVHRVGSIVIALVLVILAGCQSTGEKRRFLDLVDTPTATVEKVEVLDQSTEAVRVAITIRMANKNDVPLPLTIARYSVTLPGVGKYQGDQRPQATIPAESEQTFVLTAAIPTGGEVLSTDEWRANGSVEYEPPGEIRMLMTESGVPLPTSGFRGSGELVTAK